jgi:putative MATE family efflux protein
MAVLEATVSEAPIAPRTHLLLEGSVLPTLLRLSAPNLAEAAARVGFIAADAAFVGWLGADALAGVSLVFPVFLIAQMTSASGFGTGVSAAVGRALGAGDRQEADALAAHALWLALALGAFTSLVMLLAGPPLYRLAAGGATLEAAVTYSTIVFGGIVLVWLMNLLANVVRGTGNMAVSAGAIVLAGAVHLALSPVLIFGWGMFPRLGIAGAAIAILASYGAGAAALLAYLLSRGAIARLRFGALRPQWRLFAAILGIGSLASVNVLLLQATTIAATALVAAFGAAALAGYGAAQRLELLQIPITFALGSAVIAMIATNVGAGRVERARRIARTGAALSAGIGLVFAIVALFLPRQWMSLFLADGEAVAVGVDYLRTMGGTLPFLGFALGTVFALLAAGHAARPVAASVLRFALVAAGGFVATHLFVSGISTLFVIVAASTAAFAAAVIASGWTRMRR